MNKYSTEILDAEALCNTMDNNSDLVKELIRLYLNNLPNLMPRIQQGVMNKDCPLIAESAHALKGMSFNISAKKVADAAFALEKAGRNSDIEKCSELSAVLEKNMEELRQALDDLVKNELG